MALQNILDGAASFGAALITLAACGIPVWYTVKAIRADLASVWVYGPTAVLGIIGIILVLAFGRKGLAGIAPTRQRRR